MLRGLVFAAAMVVVRLVQGALINAWQTQAGLISIVLLLLFVIGVVVWGVLDGRADATARPDPDRRQDLAMAWLLAGLVAGVLSGAVSWLIALFYNGALHRGPAQRADDVRGLHRAHRVPARDHRRGCRPLAGGPQVAKAPETHHGLGVKRERGRYRRVLRRPRR